MEILSIQSLQEAINKCYRNERYRIGIAFASLASFDSFTNSFDVHDETIIGIDEAKIRKSRNEMSIVFENGSYLNVFIVNHWSRGKKFNELLYEKDLSIDVINLILKRMLIITNKEEI